MSYRWIYFLSLHKSCSHSKGGNCDPVRPWRMADGSCNNLDNPLWGGEISALSSSLSSLSSSLSASNTAFQRILLPEYSDGVWKGKVSSVTGSKLPSARLVSAANEKWMMNHHLILLRWASTSCLTWTTRVSWTPTMWCSGGSSWTMTSLTLLCSGAVWILRGGLNLCVYFLCRLSNDNSSGIQCCNDDGSGPIRQGLEERKKAKILKIK